MTQPLRYATNVTLGLDATFASVKSATGVDWDCAESVSRTLSGRQNSSVVRFPSRVLCGWRGRGRLGGDANAAATGISY